MLPYRVGLEGEKRGAGQEQHQTARQKDDESDFLLNRTIA